MHAATEFSTPTPESEKEAIALLQASRYAEAVELIQSWSASDRLRWLARLAVEEQQALLAHIDPEQAADYLHELPEVQVVSLLGEMAPERAATLLEEMPKDEQADLVGELPTESMEAILAEMDSGDAIALRKLVEFDDEEAGGLMLVEFVAFPETGTVAGAVEHLRRNVDRYSDFDVQYVYVVDAAGRLRGVLRLRDLLLSPGNTRLSEVMIANPLSVSTRARLKDLHAFFVDHAFIGVPVVDEEGRLVGVLRRGDVEEAMTDRYAEFFRKSQGIVSEELRTMPVGLRSRRRLSWLSINIVLNLLAASVIAAYQDTLSQVIALAVFLPIISDMSGCSGNQAVAVSMRELSLGLVEPRETWRVWMQEVAVGWINGLALGILIALVAGFWQGNPWLGAVVGFAMMLNTLIAVSLGGTLPLLMRRWNLDPALASGPILTTVTDMCGFLLVLGTATLVLDRLI